MNDVFNDRKKTRSSYMNNNKPQNTPQIQNKNLSNRFARRLLPKPVVKKPSQEIVTAPTCVICQEPLQKVNKIILSCTHEFCATCILNNLKYTRKCPLCRFEIVKDPFHSLERSVAKFIVSEVIQDQPFAQIVIKLHELFKKSDSNLLNNNVDFNRECVIELTEILGNFGLDICDYIRLLYRK